MFFCSFSLMISLYGGSDLAQTNIDVIPLLFSILGCILLLVPTVINSLTPKV